ncbi:hypothetical protein TrCOL_g1016 [Triparma columacea]|uniref:BTB domain-containing protein n=1 Tax=Triparma columacea TaxID=722753 RepID=A0A9W7GJS1_9STRA|nr:hypothetical protein TrCOL_g1016 [Triparma columacea]
MAEQQDNNNGNNNPPQQARGQEHIEFTVRAAEDLYLRGTQRTELRVASETNYSCLMLKSQRFSSLFRHYAKYHGLKKDTLEYFFVSELQNDDTPESVMLQRGDVIMVQKKKEPENVVVEDDDPFRVDMITLMTDAEHQDAVFVIERDSTNTPKFMSPSSAARHLDPIRVKAHKSILTARGEYFKGLFRKGCWSESDEGIINVGTEFNEPTIRRMLEWVYSNRIRNFEDCSAQDAMDLLRLSDKWLLRDLKRICELKLISMIQIENCAKLLCATHEYDAKRLRTATVKFIMDNVKEVTTLKGFKDEMNAFPQLLIPLLQEAAELIPEGDGGGGKRRRVEVVKIEGQG